MEKPTASPSRKAMPPELARPSNAITRRVRKNATDLEEILAGDEIDFVHILHASRRVFEAWWRSPIFCGEAIETGIAESVLRHGRVQNGLECNDNFPYRHSDEKAKCLT